MPKMTKKEKNAIKNERLRSKSERADKLTNWYMINLCYGVLAIIAAIILRRLYDTPSVLVYMQTVTWIATGVFVAAAAVLFALGKSGNIKNISRARNYSIFMLACALGSLWLALFNKIRPIMEKVVQSVASNRIVSSYWNTRILIIAIVAYLVIAFVYYVVKLYKLR